MPIPKPKNGEEKDQFISRCMSDDIMQKEFPDDKKRAGVCYSQWKAKEIKNSEWFNREKKTVDVLSVSGKFVLEKTYGGEDKIIQLDNNILLAEKYNEYHVYDIIEYMGEDVRERPWHERKKLLNKLNLRQYDNVVEAFSLTITDKSKLDIAKRILGSKCRLMYCNEPFSEVRHVIL